MTITSFYGDCMFKFELQIEFVLIGYLYAFILDF